MTRTRLYLLTALCLIATVPWFFTGTPPAHILGFPAWAFYSFCATILYAIVLAVVLHRYWPLLMGDADPKEKP